MSITRAWKVYGAEGHRQRESFYESYTYDFSNEIEGTRILEVLNADKTGTNDYSLVRITRNNAMECESEFDGQLTDGIFENSRVGKVVEVEMDERKQRLAAVLEDEENITICFYSDERGTNNRFFFVTETYTPEQIEEIINKHNESVTSIDKEVSEFATPTTLVKGYWCELDMWV